MQTSFIYNHCIAHACRVLAIGLACTTASAQMPATIDTSFVPAKDPGSTLREGWQYGAFMEIFVRGYQDSDGDGIGDLQGLTQRLDYLKDLGIKGIWLMPVTASADHDHGYATTDFRALEKAYGSLEDFDEFLRQAHARGIGVIMDYVINHSAASHPMFVSAASSKDAPFRDWFVWQDPAPQGWDIWGKNPWTTTPNGTYFGTFGPHMPDFNMRNPATLEYHQSSLRFWLNRGLDGYRLDAVPHLIENNAKDWNDQPESRKMTSDLRQLITNYNKRYVVCEATAKPLDYGTPELCGSAFAFGHQYNIVKAVKGDVKAIADVADYFRTAPPSMATMVSNHDIFAGDRLWDQVNGNMAQYKLAAATYLLQPGTPFIYYGEEIGMGGIKGLAGDEPLRAPMAWASGFKNAGFSSGTPYRPVAPNAANHNVATQSNQKNSILAFYKTLLRLRNDHPSIARGHYEKPFVQGQVMGYQRSWDKETTLVLTNYGKTRARIALKDLPTQARLMSLYPATKTGHRANRSGTFSIAIPAQSTQVFLVRK
jgi:glycosidase